MGKITILSRPMNTTKYTSQIGINPLTTTGCMELLEAAASKMNKLNLLDASVSTLQINM